MIRERAPSARRSARSLPIDARGSTSGRRRAAPAVSSRSPSMCPAPFFSAQHLRRDDDCLAGGIENRARHRGCCPLVETALAIGVDQRPPFSPRRQIIRASSVASTLSNMPRCAAIACGELAWACRWQGRSRGRRRARRAAANRTSRGREARRRRCPRAPRSRVSAGPAPRTARPAPGTAKSGF